MNTLSMKCKYALRALYRLTRESNRGPLLIAYLAKQEKIPQKFLEAILVQLKRTGIVASRKGRGGGYLLAVAPGRITLGSIVRAVDGPLSPLPCARERADRLCPECSHKTNCETRLVMREVRDAIAGVLDHTTLEQICSRIPDENASALDYVI